MDVVKIHFLQLFANLDTECNKTVNLRGVHRDGDKSKLKFKVEEIYVSYLDMVYRENIYNGTKYT